MFKIYIRIYIPRNARVANKLPLPFLKKPLCMGDLLPACEIFLERPENSFLNSPNLSPFVISTNHRNLTFKDRYFS